MDNKNSQETEENKTREKEVTVDNKIIQILLDDSSKVSLDDFHANDKKVLSLLSQDNYLADGQYTFNGLVRKLGIHQQSLARALRRLKSIGLVKKTNSGYKLSNSLDSILVKKSRIDLENLSKKISRQHIPFEQILQVYIPTTVNVEDIVNKLVGKWFGNLRWIGLVEGEGGYILQWAAGDRFQVNLKIISRYAIISSNTSGEKSGADVMVSAYKIFEQITKIIKTIEEHNPKTSLGSFSQYN